MKISDEVRDDAAILCAAMADWIRDWPPGDDIPLPLEAWARTKALRVSRLAASAAFNVRRSLVLELWREAEALLRDGWCPGDPVHLRKVSP